MIQFQTGNLFESKAEALVNTVNLEGVMGKGVALQFKNAFPNNYRAYKKACKEGEIDIGKLFVFEEHSLLDGKKIIINFPTKTQWRKPSEYSYIEKGLEDLKRIIIEREIKSVALPPLGSGNGGLDWKKVKKIIVSGLKDSPAEIIVYEPNAAIKEIMRKERVKLTPARAMLLYVLFDLTKHGEFVSEFSAEKTAYFLQKLGAKDEFKLEYKPNFYGPYSGKIRHVLNYLNGSYITGYASKDKKPFEEIGLVADGEQDILDYLNKPENKKYKEIADNTKEFLRGFYSDFGLELLSTVDFIRENNHLNTVEEIKEKIENWSYRKSKYFGAKPQYIKVALDNLNRISTI